MLYNRVVRQFSQIENFEDIQKKIDWYDNNFKNIERNRTSEYDLNEIIFLKNNDNDNK